MRTSAWSLCATIFWAYFVATSGDMAAAQNPCVPNWQWTWKVPPSLEITAPTNETDRCVGPTAVTAIVTPTNGVKWQVDMNNCPLSPPGTNETTVPITPVNEWSLYSYPPGSAPLSGNGTTAVFTNIHGGSVVVQFTTRATVASPPWDSGLLADRCNPFRVFEVISLLPDQGTEIDDGDGNPNTKMFVVCREPGSVTVTVTPNPSVTSESELPACWTLVGGTGTSKLTRTINKAVAGSYTVTCTAGTSSKVLVLKVVEVASATVSEGTEIDDGDGNPNTKTFVLCKGTGNATVMATANPSMTEAQLVNTCWNTTGGTGTAKLTRTVSKATAGSTPVNFAAGTSYKTVTVKVVEVANATVSEGTEVDDRDGNPNTKAFLVCTGTGNVTITATANPIMTEAQLANTCWTTAGGTGTAKLTRTVSKAAGSSPTTVTFTAGTSSKSVKIIVDWEPAEWWVEAVPSGGCLRGQNPPVCLFTTQDDCGNTLEIWCDGVYKFKYNGVEVGTCIHPWGQNAFWYRMTRYGLGFHSTWHMTCDCADITPPGTPPGCDHGTQGKYDWKVWQYNCITGTPQGTCRESSTFDDEWFDPNNTPNGVTAGEPSACP